MNRDQDNQARTPKEYSVGTAWGQKATWKASSNVPVSLLCGAMLLLVGVLQARAARIKDISTIQGIRSNQIRGFGLVTGLAGTGSGSDFTAEIARNMLTQMRAGRGLSEIEADNIAAVIVTAELPPFARQGSKIDVVVSTLDDSKSLRGGTLIQTPLSGADGEVYAVAQGPLSVASFAYEAEGASIQQGHPTRGRIPDGAIVEKGVGAEFLRDGHFTLTLHDPDFVTAGRVASAIELESKASARVVNPGSIEVTLSGTLSRNLMMEHIGAIQGLSVRPDSQAVVVINERTGTVVAGQEVGISSVAVSHGTLTVITKEQPEVSQPPGFTGETRTVPRSGVAVMEGSTEKGGLNVLKNAASVSDVARALNALGASPRDIIAIFQAIKQAGALHAKLKIM